MGREGDGEEGNGEEGDGVVVFECVLKEDRAGRSVVM